MEPWVCSVQDIQAYNCDMWGLREIHSNRMSTTEAQTP